MLQESERSGSKSCVTVVKPELPKRLSLPCAPNVPKPESTGPQNMLGGNTLGRTEESYKSRSRRGEIACDLRYGRLGTGWAAA